MNAPSRNISPPRWRRSFSGNLYEESPPSGPRRMQGGFWTLPRWRSRRHKYRTLRSPEEETAPAIVASSKPKRPSLLDQLVRRLTALSRPPAHKPTPQARGGSGGPPRVPAVERPTEERLPAGLRNLGNTCFMNAVLQCLSSTDMLSEYLMLDHYRRELLNRNKRRQRHQTLEEECVLVDALIQLLRALWAAEEDDGDCEGALRLFRAAVARQATQYEGSDQHDAQEFLVWLLDHLHQELQACKRHRNHKTPPPKSRGDLTELSQHQRWRSPVGWLFEGSLRLRLTCPRCNQLRDSFDPFLGLSLPLPTRLHRKKRTVSLRLTLRAASPPQVRVQLEMSDGCRGSDLITGLASIYKVPEGQLMLLEETEDGLGTAFDPGHTVPVSGGLLALQLPHEGPPPPDVLLVVCRCRVGNMGPFFGWTFAVDVPRDASYVKLQKRILEALEGRSDTTEQELRDSFSLLLLVGAGLSPRTISADVDHPLLVDAVELALLYSRGRFPFSPPHVRLLLEWDSDAKDRILPRDSDEILDDSPQYDSVNVAEESITLEDCLAFYFTEEKLEPDEAWLCPHCNSRQQGVAQLTLWSCPQILVVHLKRFKQDIGKLSTPVEVPLRGLNLGPYLCPGAPSSEALYDLYALCNHHGSGMHGGHYTACCRHPVDGRWYHYDDTRVRRLHEEEVVTCDAYLLFFVLQKPSGEHCARSPFTRRQSLPLHSGRSRSHDDLCSPPRRTHSVRRREPSPKTLSAKQPSSSYLTVTSV
ncbi:ubiquitin carboxyl-terminal hydrolase 4-like isoform X2 [Ornithodoros turicata]|uniref:ubiquitin carboxyl-terminal hydrolase 4-like isoform X2 n=1 Tax=Ornithodoros turicata TaxID=34597 RepID=UPI003139EF8B